ncbi:hypothetical protein, partial [Klebsiella pneumoniae]|uniref:hypothetical protein n=1 Tax=Klebsiella pneumoniae TaxID=573 RepID=UPI00301403BB
PNLALTDTQGQLYFTARLPAMQEIAGAAIRHPANISDLDAVIYLGGVQAGKELPAFWQA